MSGIRGHGQKLRLQCDQRSSGRPLGRQVRRKGLLPGADYGTSGKEHKSGGVAVVADTWWHAKTALDLMPIEWDVGPNGHRNSEEILQGYLDSLGKPGTVVIEEGGSYADPKSKAAKVVEATYTVPYLAHARMEPGNATAMVTPGRVDLWTGDQSPEMALMRAADEAGVTPDKVFIHSTFLGGGYGGGGGSDQVRQAVAVAKTLNGRPVKVLWTREEDLRLGEKYRPMGAGTFRGSARCRRMAARHNHAYDKQSVRPLSGACRHLQEHGIRAVGGRPARAAVPLSRRAISRSHRLENHIPVGYRRSVGWGVNKFYLESFIDELAHAAGKDPYQYRRELIARNTEYSLPR